MEYLRELFHESLNRDGLVKFESVQYDRDYILRELDEVAYKEEFSLWIEGRKTLMIHKANEILNLHNNAARFRTLKETYRKGAVVPFVGAGLSISSGYPGWTNFLYTLLADTRISKKVLDDLIEDGQYEEAAQILFDDMPHGAFLEAMENHFGCNHDLVGPVQRLPYLFSQSVITTNFDNVIQRCYDNTSKSFNEVLLGPRAQEFPRKMGEGKHILVKLHGDSNSNQDRIIIKKEYEKHYIDENALEQVVEAVCSRTLLFLGCSLTVDRTLKAMTNIIGRKGLNNVPRHYAFVSLKGTDDRLARIRHLAQCNIYPIWYPEDEDDECIEALLTKLQEGAD